MKSSAKILLIISAFLALGNFMFPAAEGIVLFVTFIVTAILDFVFMLKGETNKKLLWIHIIPAIGVVGMAIYYIFSMLGSALTTILTTLYWLILPTSAYVLSFCALLVHIDHSIKEQRIKELETELKQIKD
jgi:hypothetical protein